MFEQKLDLLIQRLGFKLGLWDRDIGRPHHHAAVPGNGEELTSVAGFRNQDRRLTI